MFDLLPIHIGFVSIPLLFAWLAFKLLKIGSREPGLPPGPPTVPILGNVNILPTELTYLKYTEWARQYGGIFSLKVASGTVIVLTSIEAVYEIMEKNGVLTANRPQRAAPKRVFGQDGSMAISMYGPAWKAKRRAAVEILKPSACKEQVPVHIAETSQLMYDFLTDPENFFEGIERSALSTVFCIVFGIRAPQHTSTVIQKYLGYSNMLFHIAEPGNIPPLDLIPILQYLPDRFAKNWKSRCDTIRRLQRELFFSLLAAAEARQENGTRNGCCLENMMDRATELGLDRENVAYTSGNFISAASHISASFIRFLVKLVIIYPEVQRKAQEEIDRVVGTERVPALDDIPNLPYFNAFLKEVYRYSTPVPLGIPHSANEDQRYCEYLVPKGATIFVNIWGLFRDPELYDSPDTFDPERYIRSPLGIKDEAYKRFHPDVLRKLNTIHFGVGRRICPGIVMGNNTNNLIASNLLWAFEFSPAKDELGRDIKLDINDISSNITNDPLPFRCSIKPRSRMKSQVILQDYINAAPVFERFERELEEHEKKYVAESRIKALERLQQF